MRIRMLVLAAVFVLLAAALPSAARDDQILASLEPVGGVVEYQPAQSDPEGPWQPVTETMFVGEGDRIRTGGEGAAYLTFFDGIETQIMGDTWVVVSTLDLPADASGDINVTFDLLVGSTFTNIELSLDASDRFEIHTPTATAVVRGTRWTTTVSPSGQTLVQVEDGVVAVIPYFSGNLGEDGLPVPVEVGAGSGLYVDLDGSTSDDIGGDETPQVLGGTSEPEEQEIGGDETPQILGGVCGNDICEYDQGEGLLNCLPDCGPQFWADQTCDGGNCRSFGRYMYTPFTNLCGNGVCNLSESAMNCSVDCPAQNPPTSCAVTSATNANIRYGPGTNFGIVGNMQPGFPISVLGTNVDGTWYAVYFNGQTRWVAASVTTLQGDCTLLQEVPAPPAPPSTTELPPEGTGSWGGCGSCNTCGHPENECVQSPAGQCLWDPTSCQNVTGNTTGLPRLSVTQTQPICYDGDNPFVIVTYIPLSTETVTACSAGPNSAALSMAAGVTVRTSVLSTWTATTLVGLLREHLSRLLSP